MELDQHVSDLLPAYAIECLEEDEKQTVANHLAVCKVCQEELRAYQSVVDNLPLAVPPHTPPDRVKQRLMERVQTAEARVEAGRTEPPNASWWDSLTTFFRRVSPAWGLASLVLVLALAASNLLLWQQVSDLRSAPPPALHVVNLDHTDVAPEASGMVVVSMDGEYGTLVVDHLIPLGANQQYQLWLIKDGKRTSGGVFSVSEDGYGALVVDSPLPLVDYDGFGITVEPRGGSPRPTGPRVLGGSL